MLRKFSTLLLVTNFSAYCRASSISSNALGTYWRVLASAKPGFDMGVIVQDAGATV